METLIHEEVNALNGWLKKCLGQPLSIKNRFNISVINALWTLIAGKRFELEDPELLALVRKVNRVTETSLKDPLNVFPWLRFIAPNWSGWTELHSKMLDIITFVGNTIKDHIKNFDPAGKYIYVKNIQNL